MSDETKPCVGCGRVHGARSPRGACDNCERGAIAYPNSDLAKRLELDRLRALIKQVEYANKANSSAFCPWCGAENEEGAARHADCPAFTPDGQVR